jgi:hypothetical protein
MTMIDPMDVTVNAQQPLQTTLARYERLLEISRQLTSTLRLDLLLEHIVNSAYREFRVRDYRHRSGVDPADGCKLRRAALRGSD